MIIPSGFGQLTLIFTGSAVPTGAVTTCGFVNSVPDDAAGIADTIEAELTATSAGKSWATTCNLTGILVKLGPNSTGPSYLKTVSISGTAGAPGSAAVAPLVKKQTASGGRKNRGRFYWGVAPELGVDPGGVLTSAYLADVADTVGDFRGGMQTAGFQLHVLHESVLDNPTPIVGLVVDSRVATQRRRQRR